MWAGSRLLVWNFWSPDAHTANNRDAVTRRPEAEPEGSTCWPTTPDRWTILPDPPDQVRRMVAGASMVWTGQEVDHRLGADRPAAHGHPGRPLRPRPGLPIVCRCPRGANRAG